MVPLVPADLPSASRRGPRSTGSSGRTPTRPHSTPPSSPRSAGWVAGGGRLVIIGGTGGPAVLAGLPDELLPYRPTSTLDIDPTVLRSFLGGLPSDAAPMTALAGSLAHGRGAGDLFRPRDRGRHAVRGRHGHDPRLRPDDVVARRGQHVRHAALAPAAAAARGRQRRAHDRFDDRPGCDEPAEPRTAADRRADRAARRVHPPDRPVNYLVLRWLDRRSGPGSRFRR